MGITPPLTRPTSLKVRMESYRPSTTGGLTPTSPPGPVMEACSTLKWVRLVI
jgi:hypothetical protein